ncbi:nucleotidyltransferase family protein [Microbulbifer celer]|uniref:Nucleotidyltransferase family protein n=1 Tax=Microbulbifer celer TaxID=435905 RepID=A0ABW3U4H1_9GAMM
MSDWCLAAGFVKNLVWDKLHAFSSKDRWKSGRD